MLLVCTWGGREFAWTSIQIVGLIALAVASAALLVRAEQRASDPVIPAALVSSASRALSLVAAAANSMVWFGLILLVPLRLQFVLLLQRLERRRIGRVAVHIDHPRRHGMGIA